MTERIREFLRDRRDQGLDDGPCLVVDLDVVRDNYAAFAKALPDSRVFYAVKANPAPELLKLLAGLGSCFDTASVAEIEMVLAAGAAPERISYGNTIKKERDIARAYALGVRLFAVDCKAEVEKIARAAPGAKVFCRIPVRLRRRRMAAVAEVRLRPGHGRRRARACAQARARSLRRVVSCRLAAAPHRGLGRGARGRRRRSSGPAPSAASVSRWSILGGGFPTKYLRERAGGGGLWPLHLPGAAQALRQPHPGDHHRAGPRHGRQCRRDRSRSRAGLEEERAATMCAGSTSTSASSAVSPRRWTSRSATRSTRRATATRSDRACSPARPAIRPTCCTRSGPTICRSAWRSATRC